MINRLVFEREGPKTGRDAARGFRLTAYKCVLSRIDRTPNDMVLIVMLPHIIGKS
jgi:hypothetical protein